MFQNWIYFPNFRHWRNMTNMNSNKKNENIVENIIPFCTMYFMLIHARTKKNASERILNKYVFIVMLYAYGRWARTSPSNVTYLQTSQYK